MNTLDLKALEQLLDVHGTDSRRWPAQLRTAALARIDCDPAAATMFDAAQVLDRALLTLPEPPLPTELSQRILASIPSPRSSWRETLTQLWSELGGFRLAGPVLACGLLTGILLPMVQTPMISGSDATDLISVAQLGDEQWQLTDLETNP